LRRENLFVIFSTMDGAYFQGIFGKVPTFHTDELEARKFYREDSVDLSIGRLNKKYNCTGLIKKKFKFTSEEINITGKR
jgi:hypothetical protein